MSHYDVLHIEKDNFNFNVLFCVNAFQFNEGIHQLSKNKQTINFLGDRPTFVIWNIIQFSG